MQRNVIETIMGAVVLVVAGAFVAFAYQSSDLHDGGDTGYRVKAAFSNVTGVGQGSDVRIGGVKVGVVDAITLAPDTYQAVLVMGIEQGIAIPADTTAAVVGDGLLGSKFVTLQPGAEERMLKDGESIEYTQASVSLEELIGKFVFSAGGIDKGADAQAEAAPTDSGNASGADGPTGDEPPADLPSLALP